MKSIACLLLAAGNSSRFGSSKQLAMIENQPMILHTINQLKPLFNDDIYVVLGAYTDDIKPLIEAHVHVTYHAAWASGMGSSIAKGVEVISCLNRYQAVMIALADQVAIQTSDYRQLWQQYNSESIIAARYKETLGVPAIFPLAYYRQLMALDGDQGARSIIRQHRSEVQGVDMPNAMLDIDTQLDLMRFQEDKSDTAEISL